MLVIANDAAGGATLARELGGHGTVPAATSEVEAAKAVTSADPVLVVWLTATVSPAKLESVAALAGRATVVVLSDDPAAPAHASRLGGREIHVASPREPRGRVIAQVAQLAGRAALAAASRESEQALALGAGRLTPAPDPPRPSGDFELDRATTVGRPPQRPPARHPSPAPVARPLPPSRRAGPPSNRPPPASTRPAVPSNRPPPPSNRPAAPSNRPPPPSNRPPPPSNRPPPGRPAGSEAARGPLPPLPMPPIPPAPRVPPSLEPAAGPPPLPRSAPPSSRAPAAPTPPVGTGAGVIAWVGPGSELPGLAAAVSPTAHGSPAPLGSPSGGGSGSPPSAAAPPRRPVTSAPELTIEPPRRRRGRVLGLLFAALVLLAGGGFGAVRLGLGSLPAFGALFSQPTRSPGDRSTVAAAASTAATGAGSATAAAPRATASARPGGEGALGPDAAYAEAVHPAPELAAVLAARAPIPGLADASVRQLVAFAEDANRRGEVEDALHFVGLALTRDPRSIAARTTHLVVLLRFGDPGAALEQADRYLAETPEPALVELRGDALAARGRFAEARAAWVPDSGGPRALARAKSLALNGGRVRAQKGQTKEAKRFFRRAAVLDMRDLEAVSAVADLLLLEGDAKAAAAWAEQACAIAPTAGAPYALRGRALVALGDAPAALTAFEHAVQYNPSDRTSVREVVRLRGAAGR